MKHCDTLIVPRWCLPVRPENTVLEGHAVVIGDGRILDILPLDDARQAYQASRTIERPDHVLLPGFVNAHTHAAMTLFRGLADDLPLDQWLKEGIWPAEKRWIQAELVRDGTSLAIAEMLRGGITCFSDQYFFPEIVAAAVDEMQIRAHIGTPIVDFPTAWARTPAEYLGKASELVHDAFVDHPMISTCFAPHSVYTLSDETFTELRVQADQLDLPIQIHLHETADEVEASIRESGMRPFERLQHLGLVNSSLLAVHAVHMTDAEVEEMAERRVAVAHCPKSNLKLAAGIAPIVAYRRAGVRVAIGTDGAASNNTLDMLSEMRTAALLAKARASDAAAVSAEHALEMATIDSAGALGLDAEIGSVEAGKWADLACVDLGTLNSQPVYDALSQLVYTARADQVSDTWVAGRHLLQDGELMHLDTASLLTRCNEWRDRIANR